MPSHQKIKINTWKATRIYLARCEESIFFLLLPFSKCLCDCTLACILKKARLGERGRGKDGTKESSNNMPIYGKHFRH